MHVVNVCVHADVSCQIGHTF